MSPSGAPWSTRAAGPDRPRRGEISLRGIWKTYGRLTAVRDVSLDIASGEFFTLLGPSGSGKSTTLMIIAGFVAPDAGTVIIEGTPMEQAPPEARNLGVVFQNYALFPHMTVFENLAFPLEMRGARPEDIARRVEQILAVVRLEESHWKYPSQLSGGQQQRVAVARALVFEPAVLLMDEPLGALDKNLRTHLQLELKHLQRQLGVTVIYVTHDQDEALTMSDRIAVMNHGAVEQVGTPQALYEAPATRFVAGFVGESNTLMGTVAATEGEATLVRLPSGAIVRGRRTGLAAGTACTLSLRPERVRLEPATDASGAFRGRVAEIVYAGETIRYWVEADDGTRLLAKRPNDGRGPTLEPGTPVAVEWRSDDARLFEGA